MVKLLVAVRVIPEDDYLRNLERPPNQIIKGERRLRVIVREPHRWQIGTLALEIQRAYKSCYQHDLPTIKYIKDNEDDCDLDPQLYVSDLLLDEGKAERDGADQRVTIKVILEQGRAVREGSVAVGSMLDNPQFQIQHRSTALPPVPKFPGVASTLGKRRLPATSEEEEEEEEADYAGGGMTGVKRPRQVEIPETQKRAESIVPSIERVGHHLRRSPELVQASQVTYAGPDQGWHQRQQQQSQQHQKQQLLLHEPKAESPELWRSFQTIPAATADELEELPGQPQAFASRRRDTAGSRGIQRTTDFHGPNGLPADPQTELSHGPLTPPAGRSTSTRLRSQRRENGASGAGLTSSNSAGKFRRRDIYDFPESDIDDTQMSPRSREARLVPRRSNDRLSRIERLQSPYEDRTNAAGHRLALDAALDALENESVFDGNGAEPQMFAGTLFPPGMENAAPADESENSIYEDAPTESVQPKPPRPLDAFDRWLISIQESARSDKVEPTPAVSGQDDAKASTPAQRSDDGGEDKENRHEPPTSAQPANQASELTHSHPVEKVHYQEPPHPSGANGEKQPENRPTAKRQRKRASSKIPVNGEGPSSQASGSAKQSAPAEAVVNATPKPAKKPRIAQRTPSFDLGEQLSQSLQESARKQSAVKDKGKKAAATAAEQKHAVLSSPLATKAPEQEQISAEAQKEKKPVAQPKEASTKSSETATAPKKTRARKSRGSAANTTAEVVQTPQSTSATVAEPAKGTAAAPTKPLPDWSSSSNATGAAAKQEPSAHSHEEPAKQSQSLTVEQPADAHVRKSPSFTPGFGLTEEEIKIMKSREGMTQEQYEAEKKRKSAETKRLLTGLAARRESGGKPGGVEKTPKAKSETPAATATATTTATPGTKKSTTARGKKAARVSFSAEDAAKMRVAGSSNEDAAATRSVVENDQDHQSAITSSAKSPPPGTASSSKVDGPAPTSSATAPKSSYKRRKSEPGPQASKTSDKDKASSTAKSPSVKSAAETAETTATPGAAAAPAASSSTPATNKSSAKEKHKTPGPAATPATKKPITTSISTSTPSVPTKAAAASSASKPAATTKPTGTGAASRSSAASSATPNTTTIPQQKKAPTPASVPPPAAAAVPTIATAKRLTDLHAAIRNATQSVASTAASSLSRQSSSAPHQRRSVLNPSTDDEESDDDSDDDDADSDDDEDDKKKKNNQAVNNKSDKKAPASTSASSPSSSASSSTDDDDDEPEDDDDDDKKDSTSKSKSKPGQGKAKQKQPRTNNTTTKTTTSATKAPSNSQPDASIRDASVDPSSDDDDDDEEL
ncbi:hypothetical protein ABEF95_014928 [Exophiala dermatitidis]